MLMVWHRANPDSRALAEVPGIGPVGAARSGHGEGWMPIGVQARHAATPPWIGLTPKDHATAGGAVGWAASPAPPIPALRARAGRRRRGP